MTFTISNVNLQPVFVPLTTTSETDIYTAESRTTILSITATNISGSPVDFTLNLYDGMNAANFYLFFTRSIAADGDLSWESVFPLPVSWTIKATASAANAVNVILVFANPTVTASNQFVPLNQR